MTAYAAAFSASATSASISISPSSSFQVRIARIEVCATNVQSTGYLGLISVGYGLGLYPTGTLSGGSTVTPVRMQSVPGSPVATATVKSGGSITGTYSNLHSESNYTLNTANDPSYPTTTIVAQLNSNYVPAFELIVANGSVFTAGASSSGGAAGLTVVVYFEEIRTARTL